MVINGSTAGYAGRPHPDRHLPGRLGQGYYPRSATQDRLALRPEWLMDMGGREARGLPDRVEDTPPMFGVVDSLSALKWCIQACPGWCSGGGALAGAPGVPWVVP